MRHSLSIQYPPDQMARNKLRFQRHPDFRYADRVPVLFGVFARYFLNEFGINFEEYFRNAETQFYWQLQFQKWAIENIPDDRCQADLPRRREQGFTANYLRLKNLPSDNG